MEQELKHHREEAEAHYRERHTPLIDTLTILSDNENYNNSNPDNDNNNRTESHKGAAYGVATSQTKSIITSEMIVYTRRTVNAVNQDDNKDDIDNMKRPRCRHGLVEEDEEDEDERIVEAENVEVRFSNSDVDDIVENKDELKYKSDALLRGHLSRRSHRRHRLNSVNNLSITEYVEEQEEESIAHVEEPQSTNRGRGNKDEMETCAKTSHLNDQQELISTDQRNNTNLIAEVEQEVEILKKNFESSATWNDYFTSDAVRKVDCTTYTEMYTERVSNIKMSMYKVINTIQLLHHAMLKCVKQKEQQKNIMEEEHCSELQKEQEDSEMCIEKWCTLYVSKAVQLQILEKSLSLMPVALSQHTNNLQLSVNVENYPCVGVSSVHVDDTYRVIVELQVEPFTISLNDLVAFHVRPLSINEIRIIMQGIILHLLHIVGLFVLHEEHLYKQLEKENETESSTCENDAMTILSALENIVRQLHGGNILFSSHDGSVTFTVLPELCVPVHACRHVNKHTTTTTTMTKNNVENYNYTNKLEKIHEEFTEVLHLPICLSSVTSEEAYKLQALAQNLRETQEANRKSKNSNTFCKSDGQTINDTNVTINLESMAQNNFFSTGKENEHVARHVDADVCTHASTLQQSQHQLRLNEIVHRVKHALVMISLSLLLGYPPFHTATLESVIELYTSNVGGSSNNSINDDKEESKFLSYIGKLIDMAISFRTKEAKEELQEETDKEYAVKSTLAGERTKECENEQEQEWQKRQYNELKLFILSCLYTIDGSECEEQPRQEQKYTMKMVYNKVHHLLRHPFFRKSSSIHVQKGNILSPLENTEEEISTHDAGVSYNGDHDDNYNYNVGKEKEHLLEVHDAVHRIIYPIYTYLSRIKEHVNCTTFSSLSSSESSEPLENCFYQIRAHRNSIFAARSTFVEQSCANRHYTHYCHNYWWPAYSNIDTANKYVEESTISSLDVTPLKKSRDERAIAKNTTNVENVKLTVQLGNNAKGSINNITHTFTLAEQSHKTFCITRKQAEELFFRPQRSCKNINAVITETESYINTLVLSHLTSCHVQILYPVKNIILGNLYNCVICVGPSRVCYIDHDCQSSVLHIASAYLCTADDVRIKKQPSHEAKIDSLNEKCSETSCSHKTYEKNIACLEWHWIGNVILDSTSKRVALCKTNLMPYCLTYPGLSADCAMVKIKPLCNFSRYNPYVIHKSNNALQLLPFHGLVNASHDYPFAHMLSYASESFVHLGANDKDTCYYYNSELHNKDVYISNVHGSCTCTGSIADYDVNSHFPFIIILDTVKEVNVTNCSHCTLVVIGSVGSVSLHSCHDMYCIFASRESVVSQGYNLIIHALVTEFLLMEECHDAAILPLYVECPWFDRIMSAIVAESSYHNNSNNEKEKKKKKKERKEEENTESEKEDVDSTSNSSSSSSSDSSSSDNTAYEINYAYETRSVLLLNILLQAYASSQSSRGVSFVECVNVELYTSEFYRLNEHVLPVMITIPFSVMHASANVHIKPKTTNLSSGQHVESSTMESFNSQVKSECNVAESIAEKQIVIAHQVSDLTLTHLTEMSVGTGEMYACTLFKEWCIDNDVDYRIAFERKSLQECLYFHINSALALFEEKKDHHHQHHRRNGNHRNRQQNRNRNREGRREEQVHSEEWKQEEIFELTDTDDDEENDDNIVDDDEEVRETDEEVEERNRLIHNSFMHVVEYKVPHIYFGNLLGVHLYRPAETLLPFSFNVHGHTLCDVTLDNITAHETCYNKSEEELLYEHDNEKNRKNETEMPNYIIITQPLRHVVLRHVNGPMHVLFTAVSHITMMDCQEITLYAVCTKINCINCHSCHVALHTNTPPEFVNCTFMEYSVWNVALDDMHLTNTVDTNVYNFVESDTINDANMRKNLYELEKTKVSLYEAVQRQYALLSIDVEVNLVHRAISKKIEEQLERQHKLQIKHNKAKEEKEVVNDETVSEESLYQISSWPFQHIINAHLDTINNNDDNNNNAFSLHTLYNAIVYTSPLPLTEIIFECCETKTNWQNHTPYAKKRNRPVINNHNKNTNCASSSTNKTFTSLMCAMPEVMYRRVESEQLTFRQRWEQSLNAECNTDANRNELEYERQDEYTKLYVRTCFNTHLCRALDSFVKHMKEEKELEKCEEPLSQEVNSESVKSEMDSHCMNKLEEQKSKHVDPYKTDDKVKLKETADLHKINEIVEEDEERDINVNGTESDESNDEEKITLLREVSGGVNDEGVNTNVTIIDGDNVAFVASSSAAENQSPYENTLSYSPPSSQLQEHKMPVILHRASYSVNEHVESKQSKCQEEKEEDRKERVHTEKNNNKNINIEVLNEELESENKETEEHEMYKYDMRNDKPINTTPLENEKPTEDIIFNKSTLSSTNNDGKDDQIYDKDKESGKCQNEDKNDGAELHENDPSYTEQNYPSTETEDPSAISVSTAIKECFQTGRAIAAATHDSIVKETHEMATPLPTNQRPASPSLSRHSSSSSSSATSSSSLVSTEFSNLVQTDGAHDTYKCQYMKNWHDSNISFSSSSSSEESSSSSESLAEERKRRERDDGEEREDESDGDDMDDKYEHRKTPSYAMQNEMHKLGKESNKMHNSRKDAKNNNNRHTRNIHVDSKKNTHTYKQIANEAASSSSSSLSAPPASTHELDVHEDDHKFASRRKTNNNDRNEESTEDEERRSSDEHEKSTHNHNRVIPLCNTSTEQLLRHALHNHYQQHHNQPEVDEEVEEGYHVNSQSNENNEHDNHINQSTHRCHPWSSSYGPNNDIAHRSRLLQVFEEVVIARAAYRAFSSQLEQTHALLERIRRISRLLEEQRRLRYAPPQSSDSDEQWSSES